MICGGYSQPNASNNSVKTHQLKHRHNRRRKKRYVMITHGLIGVSLSKPHIDCDNGLREQNNGIYLCIAMYVTFTPCLPHPGS